MMSTQTPLKERNLHDLLEGLTAAHRQDIVTFSSGHLNESNLAKPNAHEGYKSWKSAKKPPIAGGSRQQQKTKTGRDNPRDAKMKHTMTNFSLGTSGSLPAGKTSKVPFRRQGTKGPVQVSRKPSAGQYTRTDDGVLVEELRQGDILLTNSRYARPKAWVEEDLRDDEHFDMSAVSQSLIKDQNLAKLKQTFVPSHLMGITKKDQYTSFKTFENKVIRKQDALEQNVLTGVKAVEHLENKLQQGLEQLQYQGYGPNFHRLQLYSDTFDELNDQSATFGFILRTIKKEYDDYVASLLDSQGSKHKVLYEQVENMTQRQGANPRILAREKKTVDDMERQTRQMIEDNERLRRELQEELELASQPEKEPSSLEPKKAYYGGHELPPELTDQIEELHANILDKLDQIKQLRGTLRSDFVPATVVTHLEQCIKETEVELQKLQSQKEYFDRSTAEMEADLKQAIEQADTTERDSRRLWKKINAVKKMGGKQAHDVTEDDEEDEEVKWNWYIS